MVRSTRILIEAPDDPEEMALLIEPITEVDAFGLMTQWSTGAAEIGPYSHADAREIMRALSHFGLVCHVQAHQLGLMPEVAVSASRSSSAGRYVYGSAMTRGAPPDHQRSLLSRLFGLGGTAS